MSQRHSPAPEKRIIRGLFGDSPEARQLRADLLQISHFERLRIGHELHDDLSQYLAGISCLAKQLQSKLKPTDPDLAELAADIGHELSQAMDRARSLSHELAPHQLHDADLVPNLRKLVRQIRKRTGVACGAVLEESVHIYDPMVRLHLYRLTQEAIRNAIRHGRATQIVVELKRERNALCRLTIRDNGYGFHRDDPKSDGLGIRLMQYRCQQIGAKLALHNAEDGGAIVECCFFNYDTIDREPQPYQMS